MLRLESILPNFFLRKSKIFFRFLLLSLADLYQKGFFSYVTKTQASQRKLENEEKPSLVGLTPGSGKILSSKLKYFLTSVYHFTFDSRRFLTIFLWILVSLGL
jgi:hypothetical protein